MDGEADVQLVRKKALAQLASALESLTGAMDPNAPTEKVAAALAFAKDMTDMADSWSGLLRSRLLDRVRAEGEVKTEAGTMGLELDDYEVRATVKRTGYDIKKLTALLESKGIPLISATRQVISFQPATPKVDALVEAGRITKEEAAACKHDLEYRLEIKPK